MYKNILLSFFLFSSTAFATNSPEALVENGLKAYISNGAKAAIVEWIKGSGMDGSTQALSQAGALTQIEAYFGDVEGYEVLGVNEITKRSSMTLFVINYQKGAAYGRFQSYKKSDGTWVVTEFNFNTEAVQAWPSTVVFGH